MLHIVEKTINLKMGCTKGHPVSHIHLVEEGYSLVSVGHEMLHSGQKVFKKVNIVFLIFENCVLTLVWLSLIWSLGNVVSVNAGPRHQPGLMQAE